MTYLYVTETVLPGKSFKWNIHSEPDYMVSFSPGWNFFPPTGLKYCDYMLNFSLGRAQNAKFREKVYWGAKTQVLKFRFDYMKS